MSDELKQEWTDERIESAIEWIYHRGLSAGTRIILKDMREYYVGQLDAAKEREVELLVECINFVASYGIGDEERYLDRYREITGHRYGDESDGGR